MCFSPTRLSGYRPLSRKRHCYPERVWRLNGGNVQYVTMRITFNIPEFTRNERNSHCDVLHMTPVSVARLVLDDAIAAIQTSR